MSDFNEVEFHKKYERERKAKLEGFPLKADKFKKSLKPLGIISFEVEYSGSGDSGEINEVNVYPKEKEKIKIDVGVWQKWDNDKMEHVKTNEKREIDEYIKDFCYELLEDNHGRWEFNEAQSGTISWKKGKIKHEYTTYVEQTDGEEF